MRNAMKWSSTALIAGLITLAPASMAMADPASTLSATASYVVDAQGMNDVTVNWTTNGDTPVIDVTIASADATSYQLETSIGDASATSVTLLNVPTGLGDVITLTDANGDTTTTTIDVGDDTSSPMWVNILPDPLPASASIGNLAVQWTSSLNDTTGFTVSVNDNAGNQVASVDLGAGESTYVFPQLAPGNYSVTVTAHGAGGDLSQTSLTAAVADPNGRYGGGVDAGSLAQPDGTYTVTASWNDSSTTATGFDITLLDAQGNIVAQASVDGSTSTYDFTGITDATGYQVQVTAHDSVYGDETFTTVDVMTHIPIDGPRGGPGGGVVDTGITVDPNAIHVDYTENSTWTISWTEPDGVTSGMYYLLRTSAGDCEVAVNAPGDYASCVIASDTQPTVSGVQVVSHVMYFDKQSDGPTTTVGTPEPIAYAAGAPEPRSVNRGTTHAIGALPAGHSSSSMIWWVAGAAALVALAGALATFLRRRQI
jgi:hypothetical protein